VIKNIYILKKYMKTICLNNNDNVAVAIVDLKKNISLNNLVIKNFIPKGTNLLYKILI
jgi:prolyl-tRNA editing enzyme YbaK/EbsC (Cys-tRNA(Pro) deacylase)